jgi:LPS-assembly protein
VAHPNYWIRSKRTTIYPNDKIVFNGLKLYAGETPVFWFPYLSQPFDADLGLHLIPGARSNWGPYLLSSYGIMLGGDRDEKTGKRENQWLLSKWNLDLRTKRGVGMGLDLFDTRLDSNTNLGWAKLYYLNDNDASYERSDIPRGDVNRNRWKIELKHRIEFQRNDRGSTYADFNITALSDRYFLEDFEPSTFKIDPNPNNEVGIFHRNPRFLAGIYTRLRLNEFYETDTRLPEIFLDQIKAPVFNTPILHEGQTSLGIYREYLADYEERRLRSEAAGLAPSDPRLSSIHSKLEDKGFSRFHTWHEFSLPMDWDGKITIVPRGGLGVTSYWDIKNNADNFTRTLASVGVDASMKFSKVYPDIHIKSLGIDGILHVTQPYASFSQLTASESDNSFQGIDTLSPSTRPPSLEVGRFPAIDDLSNWSILRLGGRNSLLSRRDGRTLRWFTMDTYMDVFLNDLESNRKLSNLYNDIEWHPLPWMKLNLETQFPITNDNFNFSELASNFSFMPNDSMEFRFGYRHLQNHPTLNDNDRVDLRTYIRVNNAWGFCTYHRFEFDDNTLEVQEYSINHDFDSWRTSLGFIIRDNRSATNEYGLMLNFTLKNFPSVHLPLSIDSEY